MSEDLLHIVFGTGQGTGPGVHGHRQNLPQQALQAFAQTVTDVDRF